MANISEFLAAIKNAVYGEDVRDAIHDAIEAINDDFTSRLNDIITNTSGRIYHDILGQSRDASIRPLFTVLSTAFSPVVSGASGYMDYKQSSTFVSDSDWSNRGVKVMGLGTATDGDWYYIRSYGDVEDTVPLLTQKISDDEFIEFGTGFGYFSCYLKAHVSGSDRTFTVHSTLSEDEEYRILGDVYTRASSEDPWAKTNSSYTLFGTSGKNFDINVIKNKTLSIWKIQQS